MSMDYPIRVLHVVTHMNRGGLETMIMNYYRAIDRTKVQFDFLVHRDYRAHYDDEIESLGGKIFRLPRLVPWSRSYIGALDDFFATHQEYRIIHVHQDCLSGVILKAAKKHGVPVRIAHSHNAGQDKDWKYPIKIMLKRWIPKYATKLFACGKKAGDWMFDGTPYQILNNAIDAIKYRSDRKKGFEVRSELKIPRDAFVVGHVGRFSPQKNHHFLLEVFLALARKITNCYLLLVGDGNLRAMIEKQAEQLGIRDKVVFTGVRQDIPDLLHAMDVFVFPSLHEGTPVTVLEAQAAGIPCVISDGVPTDCMITDLVTMLPLSESAEVWAEHILSVRTDAFRDTRDEIVQAGYDISENAKWLQNFYFTQQKVNE